MCRSAPIQYDDHTVLSVYTETNHIILIKKVVFFPLFLELWDQFYRNPWPRKYWFTYITLFDTTSSI